MRINEQRFVAALSALINQQGWTYQQLGDVGLRCPGPREHAIHEYCHLVTLNLRVFPKAPRTVSRVVERRLRGDRRQNSNELDSLAVGVLILRALGWFREEEGLYLKAIAGQLDMAHLPQKVRWRLKSRRPWLEEQARRVIRRIYRHGKIAKVLS